MGGWLVVIITTPFARTPAWPALDIAPGLA
jgi:hypothetical protein